MILILYAMNIFEFVLCLPSRTFCTQVSLWVKYFWCTLSYSYNFQVLTRSKTVDGLNISTAVSISITGQVTITASVDWGAITRKTAFSEVASYTRVPYRSKHTCAQNPSIIGLLLFGRIVCAQESTLAKCKKWTLKELATSCAEKVF